MVTRQETQRDGLSVAKGTSDLPKSGVIRIDTETAIESLGGKIETVPEPIDPCEVEVVLGLPGASLDSQLAEL
jgi:hypothetical protein